MGFKSITAIRTGSIIQGTVGRQVSWECLPSEEEDGGILLTELKEFCRRSQWT